MIFKLNEIIHGDCIQVIEQIPDNTFDMTFADPPFNLSKKYNLCTDSLSDGVYIEWCKDWIEEMVRVTKPSGSIFIHNIPKWLLTYHCAISSLDVTFRHWIAWDAPTSPMGRSLQPSHYGILFYTKGEGKLYELRSPHKRCRIKPCHTLIKDYGGKKDTIHPFGPLVGDVWTDIHRCKHDIYKDDHPCQLPIHLLERLILLCTDEGDSVFDCFMGTGTTAIAAKRLGRQYSGIEESELYVDICNKKLDCIKVPSKLDDIWLSCYLNRIQTARDSDIYNRKEKRFNPNWKKLYKNWPVTPEEFKSLNTKDLEFTNEVQNVIKEICTPTGTKNEQDFD